MRSALSIVVIGALTACGPGKPRLSGGDPDSDGFLAWQDCDQSNAAIYLGAPDVPYDGIDSDCLGGDDYDADGDGYSWVRWGGDDCDDANPDIHPGQVEIPYDLRDNDCDPTTSDADLDGDGHLWPLDCDDADPTVHPGALERLGDAVDGDCGDDGDGAALVTRDDLVFHDGRLLRMTTFEGAPVLAMVVPSFEVDGARVPAPALAWVGFGTPREELLVIHGASNPSDLEADTITSLDLDARGDTWYAAVAYRSWINLRRWAVLQPRIRVGLGLSRLNGPVLEVGDGEPLSVDVAIDGSGEAWMAAGATDVLAWARSDDEGEGPIDASGGALVDVDGGGLWSCDADATCASWRLDDPPSDPLPLPAGRLLRARDGHRVQAGATGLTVDGTLGRAEVFSGVTLLEADVVVHGDQLVLAALDDGDTLRLAWGEPDDGPLNTTILRLADADLRTPGGVALWSDGQRVMVVALGVDRLLRDDADRLEVVEMLLAP